MTIYSEVTEEHRELIQQRLDATREKRMSPPLLHFNAIYMVRGKIRRGVTTIVNRYEEKYGLTQTYTYLLNLIKGEK